MKDCWNTIGVRGDRSCNELIEHVHCRNCPVYSAAARTVLDRETSDANLVRSTAHFAKPKVVEEPDTLSLLIVRIGPEWLAVPMAVVTEITETRPVRSLPHRTSGIVLGLVNVHGELLICVSLTRLFGLESQPCADPLQPAPPRLVVLRRDGVRVACLADEIDSIHRCRPGDIAALPSTLARSASGHSRGVVSVHGRSIGVLDDRLMLDSIQRGLA